ncbi:MAG: methyl-accepting chemotaxis protein [Cellvibrionaceae bacterium]
MLSKLKISQKIYLSSFIQLALIALVGFIGISQMAKIGLEIVDIAEEDIPLIRQLTKLTEHQLQEVILFERALYKSSLVKLNTPGAKEEFIAVKNEADKLAKKIGAEIIEIENFIEEGIGKLHSEAAKKEYKHLLEQLKIIEKDYDKVSKLSHSTLEHALTENPEKLAKKVKNIEKLQDQLDTSLIAILDEIQNFTLEAALTAEHDEKTGLNQIIIAFVFALALSLITPFVIGRSITQPIKNLNHRLKEVASGDGDLTAKLDESAKDETGEVAASFNMFMKKLRKIIGSVNTSADVLGTSSETALTVMEETVTNVQNQYSETEIVANAVSEMSTTIQSVAQSTSDASVAAESVKQRVDEGKTAAVETRTIVEELACEMNDASTVIEALASETENIGSVLDAIRGIAEQTNLLALNAAIEAARAGDTGRGFAVVADEVRSLAQRTQTSTGDIQELVEGLQKEASNAVATMRKGSERTDMCLQKSADTANAFADASEAVNEISDLNMQIATAAEEQSVVAAQINDSLLNIKNIAEVTTEGANKTSAANKNIASKLIELHTNLNQFKT